MDTYVPKDIIREVRTWKDKGYLHKFHKRKSINLLILSKIQGIIRNFSYFIF